MSVLQTIFNGLGTGLKAAWNNSAPGREIEAEQAAKRANDLQFMDFAQQKGAKFVHGGMVDDGGVLRPADKSRTATYKTANRENLQFEWPTPEEQDVLKAKRALASVQEMQPVTDLNAKNDAAAAGQKQTALLNANTTSANAQLDRNGIPIPAAVAGQLGMTSGQDDENGNPIFPKVPIDQLDNLTTAASRMEDVKSKEAARNAKPEKLVFKSDPMIGDKGQATQVVTYNDGTVEETRLNATGKSAKTIVSGSGGAAKAVNALQKQLDKYQADEDKTSAQTVGLMKERADLKAKLGLAVAPDGKSWVSVGDPPDLTPAQIAGTQSRIAKIEGLVAANTAKVKSLQPNKAAVDAGRRTLMGQPIPAPDDGGKNTPPPPAAGGLVSVTDPTGKVHRFRNKADADNFKKLAGIQ